MTPKTWLLLVLQIMQNFRISPPVKKRCCQGVCTRLTDDTTRTIPRILLVLLYNSRSLTLMISLSGEWVLIFRFASTHTLCVCNDRHLKFFPLIHFFFYFCTNAQQLFSLTGSVEAAPNRETWANFHHKTLVYFLFHRREPTEKSIFGSGNNAKLPARTRSYHGASRRGRPLVEHVSPNC